MGKSPPEYLALETALFLGPSWEPNGIRTVADAYLDAAKTVFNRQQKKTGFLEIQSWFVVHHLSYIASEIYLKSFAAWSVYSSGSRTHPDEASYDVSLNIGTDHPTEVSPLQDGVTLLEGHGSILEKLSNHVKERLRKTLASHQIRLIEHMNTSEFSRSRYPYETEKNKTGDIGERFPRGEEGRKLAEEWLLLANPHFPSKALISLS